MRQRFLVLFLELRWLDFLTITFGGLAVWGAHWWLA